MQIEVYIDGVDYTSDCLFQRTRIETGAEGVVSTASITLKVLNAVGSLYGAAVYGVSPYGSTSVPNFALKEVIVQEKDASPANVLFRGEVVRANKATEAIQFDLWTLECTGFESVLDTSIVTDTYANVSDRAIIQDAFAAQAPDIAVTSTTVDEIETNLYVDAVDWTLRELLDRLRSVSGARVFVDQDKTLYYSLESSATPPAAPFDIDVEFPDDSTTFSTTLTQGTLDYSKIANHVTVRGGYVSGGTRASYTAQDATSQTAYGIRKRVIVEEALTTSALCQARAEAEILQWKDPQAYGTFVVRRDGLKCGQKINIEARALGVSGDYIIKRITMTWENPSDTVYTVEYGFYDSRLDQLLAKLARVNSRDRKGTILALPPEDSVDTVHIRSLAVTTAKIEALAVTEAKIDSLAVTEAKIGNLAVTNGKIGNLAVTTGKIQDLAVTDAKINDLTVTKLTAGNAVFGGTASFGYGASQNKLTITSLAIKIEADSGNYLQATSGGVTLYNSGRQLTITSAGIVITNSSSVATFSSSSLKFTQGTANTEVSAGGVQIWGGTTGIGIGASTFASSPLQVTSSSISMVQSSSSFDMNSTYLRVFFGGKGVLVSSGQTVLDSTTTSVVGTLSCGTVNSTGVITTTGSRIHINNASASIEMNGTQVLTVQAASVADATGAGDIVAQFNTLLSRLRGHGIIAT